jgi:hypothetical protein
VTGFIRRLAFPATAFQGFTAPPRLEKETEMDNRHLMGLIRDARVGDVVSFAELLNLRAERKASFEYTKLNGLGSASNWFNTMASSPRATAGSTW